jgi:hypothetical protein
MVDKSKGMSYTKIKSQNFSRHGDLELTNKHHWTTHFYVEQSHCPLRATRHIYVILFYHSNKIFGEM